MYNNQIYKELNEKFSSFNMPLVCEVIAEYMDIIAKNSENRTEISEREFEATWWKSAIETSEKVINEEQ